MLMTLLENGFTIRELEMQNIDGLAALHKKMFTRPWGAHDFALFLQDKHMLNYGAFPNDGRQPSGFVLIRKLCDQAEIITIAVSPKVRRRGVAMGLLEAVIEHLVQARFESLHLEVEENNKAAIALYEEIGFEVTGRRNGYYPGKDGLPASHALIMTLDLTDYFFVPHAN